MQSLSRYIALPLCLLACLWLSLAPSHRAASAAEADAAPGRDLVRAMLELYRAENKYTRIQAMLLSVNVAPRAELIQALGERAEHAEDEIERAVAWYVLASATMHPSDINAFLDALLHSPRSVGGFRRLENRLLASYGDYSCKFLNRLAFTPAYAHKATCALVAAAGYSDLPEWEGLVMANGLAPTKEQFEYGMAFHGFNEELADPLDGYDARIVQNRLLTLASDSQDKETRATIYLMRLRFTVEDAQEKPVDEALYATLMSGNLDKDEAHLLRYSLLKWRDGRQPESIMRREAMEKEYIASLPTGPEDIERLFVLEKRTCREFGYGQGSDNIASSVRYGGIESQAEDILTREALEKLQAFLRHGKKYMHEADYGYLSDLAERTETIPEPVRKIDRAGVFIFTGYPNRYSFQYGVDGVKSVLTPTNAPPAQNPDITIEYAGGENIAVTSRPLLSTAYGGIREYPELRELDAKVASCKKFAADDSFFKTYHECDGSYFAYKMAYSYGRGRLFEVRYSPVDGAHMDAFLNTLRTFQLTGPQEALGHWLKPPDKAAHTITLYENGIFKEEKPAAEFPEGMRFREGFVKQENGETVKQMVPIVRVEVSFYGEGGKLTTPDKAVRVLIYEYALDGVMLRKTSRAKQNSSPDRKPSVL